MRVHKHTHPELWDVTKLAPYTHLLGVYVDDAKYAQYREEADRIYPHLDVHGREVAAMHIALTHPGFKDNQLAPKPANPVDKLHTRILIVILLIVAAILLIVAARIRAEDMPLTVIPLDDVAKVKVLSLLRQQDKLIIERRDQQLKIDELDKQIQKLQTDLNQTAQDLAKQHNIDSSQLVLDLDKLAWISKEAPK